MPPHGYERPARSGSSPRDGFAMRPAPDPDAADASPDEWDPFDRDVNVRGRHRPPASDAFSRPDPRTAHPGAAAGPQQAGGAPGDNAGPRSDFDSRREAHPRPDGGPRADGSPRGYSGPTFTPSPDLRLGRPRRFPAAAGGAGPEPDPVDTGPRRRLDAGPAPDRGGPPPSPPPANYSERIEQLLLAAQRQLAELTQAAEAAATAAAEHIKAEAEAAAEHIKAEAEAVAEKVKTEAESHAARLRTSAEFEKASVRGESEREAAKFRAATERECDDIVRAARREAGDIRRREQFLLEQSEALRSQAEADLDLELADRRAEAERLDGERLADAQEATRKLVEEAERRAADAEKRAADATTRAEQARRDAETDAKKEVADAHRKAELVIAQAKDDGKQILADLEADAGKRRTVLHRELDELIRQKAEIDDQLAKMRQLFAVGAFLDTPAS